MKRAKEGNKDVRDQKDNNDKKAKKERRDHIDRSPEELDSYLRRLVDDGLDLDVHLAVSCLPTFSAAVGGPAAVAHMVASTMKSSTGKVLDFTGELAESRRRWPLALCALRAVFEVASGIRVTNADAEIDSVDLRRIAIQATKRFQAAADAQSGSHHHQAAGELDHCDQGLPPQRTVAPDAAAAVEGERDKTNRDKSDKKRGKSISRLAPAKQPRTATEAVEGIETLEGRGKQEHHHRSASHGADLSSKEFLASRRSASDRRPNDLDNSSQRDDSSPHPENDHGSRKGADEGQRRRRSVSPISPKDREAGAASKKQKTVGASTKPWLDSAAEVQQDRQHSAPTRATPMEPLTSTSTSHHALGPVCDILPWVLCIGRLTKDTLAQVTAAAGGPDKLCAALEKTAETQIAVGAPWVAGAAWSIAFAAKAANFAQPTHFAGWLEKVACSGGNVLQHLKDDLVNHARFFAAYPKAVDCVTVWSQAPSTLGPLAISAIATELTRAGDVIPCRQLNEALGWPVDTSALLKSLSQMMRCPHKHPQRAERLAQIHEHLAARSPDISHIPAEVQSVGRLWHDTVGDKRGSRLGDGAAEFPKVPQTAKLPGDNATAPTLGMSAQILQQGPEAATAPASERAGSRGKKKRQYLPTTLQTHADLRSEDAPEDPRKLHGEFKELKAQPKSPGNVDLFAFRLPSQQPDRIGRWNLWGKLARIGVFVREYFEGMSYEGLSNDEFCNASAGLGAPGQFVVFTDNTGTILRMATGRLYAPNATGDLVARMRVIFEPFSDGQNASELMGDRSSVWGPSNAMPELSFNA